MGWRLRPRNWRCSANSAPGARSRHACATGRATTSARTHPVAAGALLPKNKTDLAAIEDMHPRTVRQDGDFTHRTDRPGCAPAAERMARGAARAAAAGGHPLLKSLRAIGQREAETLGIAPELMLRKKILEALLKSGYPDGPLRTTRFPPRLAPRTHGPGLLDALEAHETNLFRLQEPAQRTRCTSTSTSAGVEPRARGPAGAVRRAATCLRPAAHPERQLAREDVAKVLENIERGFHLQMPPGEERVHRASPGRVAAHERPALTRAVPRWRRLTGATFLTMKPALCKAAPSVHDVRKMSHDSGTPGSDRGLPAPILLLSRASLRSRDA